MIPLYRIETPVYAVVPPVVHQMGLVTLGTFHERQGEQSLLRNEGALRAAWGRVVGQDAEQSWSGTVSPTFDGSLWTVQAGVDLFARRSDTGHRDHVGLFVGRTRADGDVRGFAIGWNNLTVGDLDLDDKHAGVYWTHIGPNGWYLDGVILGSRFDGEATSDRALGIDLDGDGVTASIEGGYPFALGSRWTLEPQAQLIWQNVSFDDTQDRFAAVSYDPDDAVTARVGLRLIGNDEASRLHLYLKANLWHGFGGDDLVRFGPDRVVSEQEFDAFEFGGGVVAALSENVSLHIVGDYTTELGDEERGIFEANVGLRVDW